MKLSTLCVLACLCLVAVPACFAQVSIQPAPIPPPPHHPPHRPPPQIIIPPFRPRTPHAVAVELTAVGGDIQINDQVATTVIELTLTNRSGQPQEAQIILPVPDGVAVRSLQYDGIGPEPTAEVLPREEARRIYESIVTSMRDPALVEFVGFNLIKTSAFPVPPGASQKLRLTYEQVLPIDSGRIDYFLPRSESLASSGTVWNVQVVLRSKAPISTVFSSSHEVTTQRHSPNHITVHLAGQSGAGRGSVRLSYLVESPRDNGFMASLSAYPDGSLSPEGGGYFLLLGGLPATLPKDIKPVKREVVLVIDRSGSMRGTKMAQALAAATQVIDGLELGEAFNIIDYSDSINSFAERPVIKTSETTSQARVYIAGIQANGGTNIHDAMLEAVRQQPTEGMLPLVIFLTDGLPTVGERNEVKIREAIRTANRHERRVFTFGVGVDVNTPLLSNIASSSRGASTFVMPEEDVEVKVSQVFRRLCGPILASPRLVVLGSNGEPSTRSIRELMPAQLPDLFEGDQLVLLGQYVGGSAIRMRLEGSYLGTPRSFEFELDAARATTKNSFVPRLWANRKVATLIDEVRQAGAEGAARPTDARMKELVDEIIRLSTKFGILTEYTAFLAREDSNFSAAEAPARRESLQGLLRSRAAGDRDGVGAVNQEVNIQNMQTATGGVNAYFDAEMKEVEVTTIQNIADQTFFQRGSRWVDARILDQEDEIPDRVFEFATPEYMRLAEQLASEGRQGVLALGGEVYLLVGSERVLVRAP